MSHDDELLGAAPSRLDHATLAHLLQDVVVWLEEDRLKRCWCLSSLALSILAMARKTRVHQMRTRFFLAKARTESARQLEAERQRQVVQPGRGSGRRLG